MRGIEHLRPINLEIVPTVILHARDWHEWRLLTVVSTASAMETGHRLVVVVLFFELARLEVSDKQWHQGDIDDCAALKGSMGRREVRAAQAVTN